jgi:hypothetical protein
MHIATGPFSRYAPLSRDRQTPLPDLSRRVERAKRDESLAIPQELARHGVDDAGNPSQ